MSDELKPYLVSITETLQKEVAVVATDIDDAEQQVRDAYSREDYVLTSDDFIGTDFNASLDERSIEILQKEGLYMDENNTPLAENEYVKELLGILQDNDRSTDGLTALLSHVNEMESFVKTAEEKISEMKSQLATMQEVQNHPVKTALQNAIKTLEAQVAKVKERLSALKNGIIKGCKNAVAAFKEKGISALDDLALAFDVKDNLNGWKENIQFAVQTDKKAIAKIEAFSKEYHSAGGAIKNMARVAVGKPPKDAKKESGKLAKVMSAPYRAHITVMTKLRRSLDKMTAGLDTLEGKATEIYAKQRQKPSILKELAENKARVAEIKRDAPVLDRAKGVEI